MKKIFILLFVLSFGKTFSQAVTVYSEDFTSAVPPALPSGWSAGLGYFLGEDGANMPCGTTCTLVGSSGGTMISCYDGGVPDAATSPIFSTLGKSTMTMDVNQFRESISTITFTMFFSIDGGATFTISVPFTNTPANCIWGAVPSFTLPSSIDNQTSVCFQIRFNGGVGGGEFNAFDDIFIKGIQSPIFYYSGSGAIDTYTNWGSNPNGTGTAPTSFTTIAQTFYLTNAASVNFNNMVGGSITFGGASSILHIGTGTTSINAIIPTTNNLVVGNGCVLQVNNQATLTLQNSTFPTSSVTLMSGSAVDYAQVAGPVINVIPAKHYDMLISGGADVTSVNTFTVSNNFIVSNGNYKMGVIPLNTVFLLGPINMSASGSIKTATSKICIDGSGSVGTINFTGALAISQFTLNRVGQTLTFGSNLTINSIAYIPNGNINLNGKSLKLNGATTFGTGTFAGSTTSSLSLGGSGAITGTLLMDQTSATTRALSDLTLNRASSNLTLGNPIEIWSAVTPSVGTITTGGNLKVRQDITNKGRIGTISSGSFIGNVTVETFILGGNTGWALLGASGINGQTMNDWYGQFPMAIEGSATGVTSAGGYFESVQGWNEGNAYGYDTTITVATGLGAGKGYWVYLGTGQSTTSDIVLTLTGAPITGNVTIPLTNSAQSGTCLVANPYASPISWTALRNANPNVTNAIYIYNADGPYASFVNGVGTNGGSDAIAEGQGFYVEALTGTSLAAKESNKISSSAQVMRETSTSAGLPIKLKINGFGGEYDETAIRFHGAATNAYDIEWDARKIFQTPGYVGYPGGYSKYTTISTKGGNLDYSINSLPYALTQNAVIPVLVKVMASGQYTITGQDMQLLPPGACVTLKDKLLNITYNIKASPYVFTINDTTSHARFELTVCADVTTGLNDNATATTSIDESIKINDSENGVFINLNFDKTTKAKISVTNILGQKIIENKFVTTQNDTVYLGLEAKNQLIFVTVETDNNKVTKKVIH